MNVKTLFPHWARVGAIFFFSHLIISIYLFNFQYRGEYNLSSLFAMTIDLPVYMVVIIYNKYLLNNHTFYLWYFPIAGSLFYGILGITIALIAKHRKK